MKKVLHIVIITACMSMLVSAKQAWVPFISSAAGTPSAIKVVEFNTSRAVVPVTLFARFELACPAVFIFFIIFTFCQLTK